MKWILVPLFWLLYNSTHGQPRPTDYRMNFQQDSALRKWTGSIPGFTLDAFVYTEASNFDQFTPDTLSHKDATTYFNTYGKLLNFSPDKKQWLDFYSYQVALEKAPKGRYRAYIEVDQALLLGNTAASTRRRIAFMGASSWIEETLWLDNHTFIAVGVTDVTKGLQPFIYMGDTHTRKLYHYRPSNERYNRDRNRKYVSWQWAKMASRIIEE
ncbi:hypothetical protein HHL17_21260 [Chitinophaga sp. G-6-1-13]|uniref:Uncharacterized protein n=1 Tax=Chitinophaga fulva TaxID=2728842 RepID=A0A848GQB4_9BACT|nr:hypothetical protein [Chitinophaga fulva]NML39741.1 hypothetical protein [Chitinophaga fulva]